MVTEAMGISFICFNPFPLTILYFYYSPRRAFVVSYCMNQRSKIVSVSIVSMIILMHIFACYNTIIPISQIFVSVM